MYPLLKLACTDTHLIGLSLIANGGKIWTVVFFILLVSYGVILHSWKTHGLEGNHKAFYTCASHMMVVVTFITPILNPLIYTLRNAEMKNAMRTLWSKNVTLVGRGHVGHDTLFF